jgi:hypothetical protein
MNGNTVGYNYWKINTNAGCCNSGLDLFEGMSVTNLKVSEVCEVETMYFYYICTALLLNLNCLGIS